MTFAFHIIRGNVIFGKQLEGLKRAKLRKEVDCGRRQISAFIKSRFLFENLFPISPTALLKKFRRDLFKDWLGVEESVRPALERANMIVSCVLMALFLFATCGLSADISKPSHTSSPLMFFSACRETVMTTSGRIMDRLCLQNRICSLQETENFSRNLPI